MKLSSAILAASLGLAWAHDDRGQHVPKLLGLRKFVSGLEARRRAAFDEQPIAARSQHLPANQRRSLKGRQDDDDDEGRCGPGIGACPNGECCSFEGCDYLSFLFLFVSSYELTNVVDGVEGV